MLAFAMGSPLPVALVAVAALDLRLGIRAYTRIFYDIGTLLFPKHNFTRTYFPDLWSDDEYTQKTIPVGAAMKDVMLTVAVTAREPTYRYELKEVRRKIVENEFEDALPVGCTMLVFEKS